MTDFYISTRRDGQWWFCAGCDGAVVRIDEDALRVRVVPALAAHQCPPPKLVQSGRELLTC